MPRVPEYNLPDVAPQGLPGVRQEAAYNGDMLATGARQVQALGQAGMQRGTELAREHIDAQDMANQVRLNDAKNQLLSQQNALTYNADPNQGALGFQAYRGKDALAPDPATGQPIDGVFADKLKQSAADITDTLGNDAQKRAFSMYANDAVTGFQQHVQSHMLQESNTYTRETNNGTIQLASDTAALAYNNPDIVKQQVDSAKAAAYSQSVHDGLPGAAQTMAIRDAESGIHRRVIESALENNNPLYAMQYKDDNKDNMTAQDTLAVLGKLNHQADAFAAQGVVNNTTRTFATRIAPTDMDRLTGIVSGMESGGKETDANGNVLTSSAGAKGSMQVMDGTNKDPGFGVTPAKDNSPEERARVGRDYLAAMVTKYGDVGKALAAYNAGPGAVDDAVKADPKNWLASLPKETQAYVSKGVSQFNTGGGAPVMPTKMEFVSNALAQLPGNSRPELVAMTRQQAEAQYTLLDQSRKEQGEQALAGVQKALVANGGVFTALPVALTSALTRYAPDKYDDALKFGKAIASGENATNTEAYAMAVTYPGELAKMTDATFVNFLKTNFSVRDQEKISRLRAEEINGKTDDSSGGLNAKAMNTALANRLTSYGIAMPTAKSSVEDKARVGAIQKYVADDIFAQQQQLGRKMTAQEVSSHIDGLFSKDLTFKTTVLGFTTGTSQRNMLTMKPSDIPGDDRTSITNAFNARGVTKPTDDQIMRAYWTAHKNARN